MHRILNLVIGGVFRGANLISAALVVCFCAVEDLLAGLHDMTLKKPRFVQQLFYTRALPEIPDEHLVNGRFTDFADMT